MIAPGIELDAREVLQRKQNMRVVVAALDPELIYGVDLRSVLGALLVQFPDRVDRGAGSRGARAQPSKASRS